MNKSKFRSVIGEAIGEASMCWSETPTGVFDSTRAEACASRVMGAVTPALAVAILREAFQADPDYRDTWKANISMAFQNEFRRSVRACAVYSPRGEANSGAGNDRTAVIEWAPIARHPVGEGKS